MAKHLEVPPPDYPVGTGRWTCTMYAWTGEIYDSQDRRIEKLNALALASAAGTHGLMEELETYAREVVEAHNRSLEEARQVIQGLLDQHCERRADEAHGGPDLCAEGLSDHEVAWAYLNRTKEKVAAP